MKYLFLILFSFHVTLILAQTQLEWGKCPISDFQMEKYPQDTTADAVILQDVGIITATVDPFEYTFDHHRRMKIFTQNGMEQATITIPYYKEGGGEFIRKVKAQVLQPNGQHIELQKTDFYKEEVSNYWAVLKFTFPNLQPGSIIEYKYELVSNRLTELKDWYFQQDIPVRYSHLKAGISERLQYIYLFQGAEYLQKQADGTYLLGESTIAKINPPDYEMQNVPAFKQEPFTTTEDDYKSKIKFQLDKVLYPRGNEYYAEPVLSSWDEIRDKLWMYEFFGEQFTRKANFKTVLEAVLPLTLAANTQKTKAKIIYDYLAKNLAWNNINAGIFALERLDKAFEKKSCTHSEANLMLLAVLRELEIEAHPILTSSRDHGRLIPISPILDQFNYLLVQAKLDGEWLLLDVGDPLRPMGYPSVNALNYKGWKLERTKHEWIDIEMPLSKNTWVVRCTIEGNSLVGQFQTKSKGYYALEERMDYREDNTGNYWSKKLNTGGISMRIDSFTASNYEDIEADFVTNFRFNLQDWATENDNFLYISPVIYAALKENPFKSEKRLYPVDYNYRFINQYAFQVTIPSGYEIEQLPENIEVLLPNKGGSFRVTTSTLNGKIQFLANLDIKRLQYHPLEYAALKDCYDTLIAKYDDMIVLKKL
jgi:hypothetical protein